MKFTTLRNLLASMLVLGVAASVIAVGSGTFASFNATTSNIGTFSTADIVFVNTPNGGSSCTGQSSLGTPLGTASGCGSLVNLSNMIPGDSKLGTLTLVNNSTSAPAVTVNLTTDATCTSCATSVLDSTALGSNGLGLLLFRCEIAAETAQQACTGTANTHYVPVTGYGSCTANPAVAATTGFIPGIVTGNATGSVTLGDNSAVCTGISVIKSSTQLTEFNSITLNGVTTTNVLLPGGSASTGTDNLAALVYLPQAAGNSFAGKTSTIEFQFLATQVNGSAH